MNTRMTTASDLQSGPMTADDVAHELFAKAEQLTHSNISQFIKGLPLKAKMALKAAVSLPHGRLAIKLPDGRIVRVGGNAPGPDAALILHNWNLPRRALTQGSIGVGESYIDGDWDSPDVTTFLQLFVVNEELGDNLATPRGLFALSHRIQHWFNRNTKSRAQKNISAHYDLGNQFYELWLDPSMTYSSAVFDEGANSLEAAQQAKYRKLAKATGITADDHVLEIGCGWGGFAEYAAREIGCRVTGLTISREQLDFARDRIEKAGLSDKVTLKFQDYRDETGTYDKVVSIEMFEAVGEEYWETYFRKVHDVMKPGGRAGLQIITIKDSAYALYRSRPDFIQRYVFPGGMLPSPSILDRLADETSLDIRHVEPFPQDYARTLAEWRERFGAAWPDITKLGFNKRFKRLWDFYMYYCEAGFRAEFIDVRQVVYERA